MMNNNALFRAKRIDNGEWVYGSLVVSKTDTYIIEHPANIDTSDIDLGGMFIPVDPSTVGQFTGVHDKNGKRIFVGMSATAQSGEVATVIFEYGCFVLKRKNGEQAFLIGELIEINELPELL